MPELPEVETIRTLLEPKVLHKRIEKVEIRLPRLLLQSSPSRFKKSIEGQTIKAIRRRGKYLIFELSSNAFVIHLGMTGQLTYSDCEVKESKYFIRTITGLQRARGVHPIDKHTHVIFYLEKGVKVLYRDMRTFGKFFLTGLNWEKHPRLSKLGPEPLEMNVLQYVKQFHYKNSTRSIKSLLLDQAVIAGVGNIYADEALFRANIHPERQVCHLKSQELVNLFKAVRFILKKGVKNAGTSFSDYMKPDGSSGNNYEKLMVYGRAGSSCRKCKDVLKKIVVAQRGTVFCPQCQRKIRE